MFVCVCLSVYVCVCLSVYVCVCALMCMCIGTSLLCSMLKILAYYAHVKNLFYFNKIFMVTVLLGYIMIW